MIPKPPLSREDVQENNPSAGRLPFWWCWLVGAPIFLITQTVLDGAAVIEPYSNLIAKMVPMIDRVSALHQQPEKLRLYLVILWGLVFPFALWLQIRSELFGRMTVKDTQISRTLAFPWFLFLLWFIYVQPGIGSTGFVGPPPVDRLRRLMFATDFGVFVCTPVWFISAVVIIRYLPIFARHFLSTFK